MQEEIITFQRLVILDWKSRLLDVTMGGNNGVELCDIVHNYFIS